MSRLAEGRAEYANLVASVQNHTRLVEAARKNLADARARQAGACSASVISRIDGVDAGIWPIGPSRKTITAAGGVGGLLLGFGCIFLFASPVAVRVPSTAAPVVDIERSAARAAPVVEPVRTVRTSSEAFGMFRGMTLQEAIRSVQARG
jgi:hypothetical protein